MIGRFRQLMARLLAFFRVRDLDRDFQAELDAHLAMAIDDQLRRGHTPADARRLATIRLGGSTALRELPQPLERQKGFRPSSDW